MQSKLLLTRKNHHETQEYLAQLLGITAQAYRHKENGLSEFKLNEMFILADHYGMTTDQLFSYRKSTQNVN